MEVSGSRGAGATNAFYSVLRIEYRKEEREKSRKALPSLEERRASSFVCDGVSAHGSAGSGLCSLPLHGIEAPGDRLENGEKW